MSDAKTPSWKAALVVEETKVFSPKNVDGTVKRKKNGDPLVVFHTKRTIELTRGNETISFPVSRAKDGRPLITDAREAATGAAQLTLRGRCRARRTASRAWSRSSRRASGAWRRSG